MTSPSTRLLRRVCSAGGRLLRWTPARTPAAATPAPQPVPEPAERRFQLFGVGLAKSGTHSLAGIFASHYRSGHEPGAEAFVQVLNAVLSGEVARVQLRRFLEEREARLNLEVNVAGWNGLAVPELVDLFPEARFVLTVREPRSWLDSLLNHLEVGKAPAHFVRLRSLIYADGGEHPPEEAILAEHGFYPLRGYLLDYARRHELILDTVPPERLLVLRTKEIGDRLGDLASFVGVPAETLDREQSHGFPARAQFGFLGQIEDDHIRATIDDVCGPVLARLFAS